MARVGDGMDMVLGVQIEGVEGSEMKLGTVGRENFAKKF